MDADSTPSRRLALLYDAVAIVTVGSLVAMLFANVIVGLYAALALGSAASFLLGYFSLQRRWTEITRGTLRFARLWFWMTLIAALALINGKSEPMLFFGTVGTVMTLLYWVGGWIGSRMAER